MPPTRIPFLLYGDGPRLRSGLARIARDLAMRLYAEQEELGIRFMQIGVDYPDGWHWQPWDFYGFQPTMQDQGWSALKRIEEECKGRGEPRPILLTIMDPSRVWDLLRVHGDPYMGQQANLQMDAWGYFPIDAHNAQGRVGGPAAEAVQLTNRVLAYGQYGAQVLRRTLQDGKRSSRVSFLPHGLEPGVFVPSIPLTDAHDDFRVWALRAQARGALRIGCVATNQARKDLGLLFQSMAALKSQGHDIACWLQTDRLTNVWDVGELVKSLGLARDEVCVSTENLSDRQLAAQYAWSDVTLAPGLGEGFGYPIVESLGCGTPVAHGKYAGGVDLIPEPRWLVDPVAFRLESCYAVQRPVFDPAEVARALASAAHTKRADPQTIAAYCSGAVAHLSWQALWPRWKQWISKGIQERQQADETQPVS